jgi:hypothetical protein
VQFSDGFKPKKIAKPLVQADAIHAEHIEVPILSQELDLLDDYIDEVVAFVVKHGKLDKD